MNKPSIAAILEPVLKTFEELGVLYYISGSVASSAYGIARATLDVDLVSDLRFNQVDLLVEKLKPSYFIDSEMIIDAIKTRSSFNIIHLDSMMKIDIFILIDKPYPQKAFERKRIDTLDDEAGSIRIYLCSPEDIILNKLVWYKAGNQVSERQWFDVLGVIKVQGDSLELGYIKLWAEELNVLDLLEKALIEGSV